MYTWYLWRNFQLGVKKSWINVRKFSEWHWIIYQTAGTFVSSSTPLNMSLSCISALANEWFNLLLMQLQPRFLVSKISSLSSFAPPLNRFSSFAPPSQQICQITIFLTHCFPPHNPFLMLHHISSLPFCSPFPFFSVHFSHEGDLPNCERVKNRHNRLHTWHQRDSARWNTTDFLSNNLFFNPIRLPRTFCTHNVPKNV